MTTPVTKTPKNVERGKKAYETHLKKIKEGILTSSESTPSNTTNSGDLIPTATPLTTAATPLTTPSSTPSITTSTLLGTGAIVVIIATYLYINRKKPAPTAKPTEQPPPKKSAAFFHMQ